MAYAKGLLGTERGLRFLEPAVGSGSLYSAFSQLFAENQVEAAQGFEVDERFVMAARELWADSPLKVTHQDFTQAQQPWLESERFQPARHKPPLCTPPSP